jgi:hypothetical protein
MSRGMTGMMMPMPITSIRAVMTMNPNAALRRDAINPQFFGGEAVLERIYPNCIVTNDN